MSTHKLVKSVGEAMRHILSSITMDEGQPLIVALSGGADSVALLTVLHALGYNVEAAHCNFHLRGAESNRDEAFCKDLCQRLGVGFHVIHFDTREYAALHKVSVEMAARDLRYNYFTQLCSDLQAGAVCIAHHRDDQVETVLLHLIRGTGLRGLIGMRPVTTQTFREQECTFLRPMLSVSEAEIREYLNDTGQDFVVDSTNLEPDVQRNKLRLDIIPMIEAMNPGFKDNVIRMTHNLADTETIVEGCIGNAIDQCKTREDGADVYDLSGIRLFVSPLSLLWTILSPLGFNRTQATEIAGTGNDGGQWSTASHTVLVSHGKLYIVSREEWERALPTLIIPEPGIYRYQDQKIRIEQQQAGDGLVVAKERFKVCLDSSGIRFPLTLRPAQSGDRLTPFGMRGTKLVADYLKDRKRSIVARHRQLVLTDASGKIIWLVGETIDEHYKVKNDTTSIIQIFRIRE